MQEVTSYFIPYLESPTFYHGREIGATQNHGWSTLRDLAAKVQFFTDIHYCFEKFNATNVITHTELIANMKKQSRVSVKTDNTCDGVDYTAVLDGAEHIAHVTTTCGYETDDSQ